MNDSFSASYAAAGVDVTAGYESNPGAPCIATFAPAS